MRNVSVCSSASASSVCVAVCFRESDDLVVNYYGVESCIRKWSSKTVNESTPVIVRDIR